MTDRKRMIGEVAARHGIRLEEDDPAFLLVTLAELALRDAQAEFLAAVRLAMVEQEQSAERIQKGMGDLLATSVAHALREARSASPPPGRFSRQSIRLICFSMLTGIAFFTAGFLLGRGSL